MDGRSNAAGGGGGEASFTITNNNCEISVPSTAKAGEYIKIVYGYSPTIKGESGISFSLSNLYSEGSSGLQTRAPSGVGLLVMPAENITIS